MTTNPLNIGLKPRRGRKATADAILLVGLSALEVEVGPYLFVFKNAGRFFLKSSQHAKPWCEVWRFHASHK